MSSIPQSTDDAPQNQSDEQPQHVSDKREAQPIKSNNVKTKSSDTKSNHNSRQVTDEMPLTMLSQYLRAPFQHDFLSEQANGITQITSVNGSDSETIGNKDDRTDIAGSDYTDEDTMENMPLTYRFSSPQTDSQHPNFDTSKSPLDPDLPLSTTPSSEARYERYLQQLLATPVMKDTLAQLDAPTAHTSVHIDNMSIPQALKQLSTAQPDFTQASKWALIASPELATHLELLQLGGLINLPKSFFAPVVTLKKYVVAPQTTASTDDATHGENDRPVDEQAPLLSPLTELKLLDLSSIYYACSKYPTLTRYGFDNSEQSTKVSTTKASTIKTSQRVANSVSLPSGEPLTSVDMINDGFAPTWEVVLYPERFDNGVDTLTTDMLACSVAVHILKQCQTRKTVNRNLTAMQLCQHMRSYVLNQCNLNPQFEAQYRQIRLFVGHVVVAASYLGLTVTEGTLDANAQQEPSSEFAPIYLNISSRSRLVARYPNISQYYINGWR